MNLMIYFHFLDRVSVSNKCLKFTLLLVYLIISIDHPEMEI